MEDENTTAPNDVQSSAEANPAQGAPGTLLNQPDPQTEISGAAENPQTHEPEPDSTQPPVKDASAAGNTVLTQDAAGEPGEEGQQQTEPEPPEAMVEAEQGMEYEEGELDEFKKLVQEQKLSRQAAKAVLAWQAKFGKMSAEKMTQRVEEELRGYVRKTAEENKQKVMQQWGPDPSVRAQRAASVARAMRAFATPQFRQLMDETGLGSHPEVVRVFEQIGNAFGEDRAITGKAGGGSETNPAYKMFPNLKPKEK